MMDIGHEIVDHEVHIGWNRELVESLRRSQQIDREYLKETKIGKERMRGRQ
jgi:hypothetical protein